MLSNATSKTPIDVLLNWLEENTKNNLHVDNLVLIAEFVCANSEYDVYELVSRIKKLLRIQEQNNSFSLSGEKEKHEVYHILLDVVENEFGASIRDVIHERSQGIPINTRYKNNHTSGHFV